MKLTDAERALVERARSGMDEACEKGATYSPFWIVELVKIIDRLSQEPEVVRCGERYTRRILGAMYCNHLGSPRFFYRVKPNDTCEYGGRRKEQDDG